MRRFLAFLLIGMLLAGGTAFASNPSPWTQETTNKEKMLGKLDFGMKNLLAGWTELLAQPYYALKHDCCALKGFGRGIYYAVADEIGGALHLLTFPITSLDVPLPNGGVLNGCGCCNGNDCPQK